MIPKRPLAIHPLVLAVYPAAEEFSRRPQLLPLEVLIRPITVIVAITTALWIGFTVCLRDSRKAALLVSAAVVLGFSYEVLAIAFEQVGSRFRHPLPASLVLMSWVALIAVSLLLLARLKRGLDLATVFANVFAVCLIAMPGVAAFGQGVSLLNRQPPLPPFELGPQQPSLVRPDIYYILLDSYTRADVLQAFYHYDNSPFLDRLRQKGFRVMDHARANYIWTTLSVASSLNATYVDDLGRHLGQHSKDHKPLARLIQCNRVAATLKRLGYRVVVFPASSPIVGHDRERVDRLFRPVWFLSPLEHRLLVRTPLPTLLRGTPYDQYALHRKSLLYIFNQLPNVSDGIHPVFVYAHVLAPHPPFVLGDMMAFQTQQRFAFGQRYSKAESIRGYAEAVDAVNQLVERTIDAILRHATSPPIIILQGDHGPRLRGRLRRPGQGKVDYQTNRAVQSSILNAYYLPRGGADGLYESITPVNTFRLIFNRYFDGKIELLPDRSYDSPWATPYQLIPLPEGPPELTMAARASKLSWWETEAGSP